MDVRSTGSVLLRMRRGAQTALSAAARRGEFGFAGSGVQLEPLFQADAGEGMALAAADRREWMLAHGGPDEESAWDAVHALRGTVRGLGMTDGVDAVEPDLLQQWPTDDGEQTPGAFAAGATCAFENQDTGYPARPDQFAWHLGLDYAQLRAARDAVGDAVVRIAHLDTGYDPAHKTFPADRIERALERNFIDKDRPTDAADLGVTGTMKNPGHGTGTLSILASGRFRFQQAGYSFDEPLGAAPDARIVPVRVGNSVVQLKTSAVAKGIAHAAECCDDPATRVHVLSMSMGGVASRAWADAVNKAYMAGVVLVTAAGNNFAKGPLALPTRHLVYPARFRRVIAACGVMADLRPYFGLGSGMQGNWGPSSAMGSALGAFTPNMPWAKFGCPSIVDMDGRGTSSATPQIAAAAALYIAKHMAALDAYAEPWARVEAVRHALFSTALRLDDKKDAKKVGNGVLRALAAIGVAPPDVALLRRSDKARASFAFFRVITGLGAAPDRETEELFALEATQLSQRWSGADTPNPLEGLIEDPDLPAADIPASEVRAYLDALREHPGASKALRERLGVALDETPRVSHNIGMPVKPGGPARTRGVPVFTPPEPTGRRLRIFAVDPSLSTQSDTADVSVTTISVPWEKDLQPGPAGEYVEVMDIDPPSGVAYAPLDLDHPDVLANDGLAPSAGSPQFHQQMVYAVCSLTVANFERALGRPALWASRPESGGGEDADFVQCLRVYPHALREANAFYSPTKVSLLFGYFDARRHLPSSSDSGETVFTCLSHDIIAHETTHALLDGMHRQFLIASNRDVHALHEGFADIVALFQRLTFPDLLRDQIARTRGQIRSRRSMIGSLAVQFGQATGARGGLREGIGKIVDGEWVPHVPDPSEYETVDEPHRRGAILVGAVFDAFLTIYERRTADLYRLATGGTGVLEPGAIHPDLVERLADELAKTAQHVHTMCIRALDYCPPTDITFGEYLRALITADVELVPNDDKRYRVAFAEAFRRRGIVPRNVRSLGVESLRWRTPEEGLNRLSAKLGAYLSSLRASALEHTARMSRENIFYTQRRMRAEIESWLSEHAFTAEGVEDTAILGLDPGLPISVETARFAHRIGPDDQVEPLLILSVLQSRSLTIHPGDPDSRVTEFVGGSTIIVDLLRGRVQYIIRKDVASLGREERQVRFQAAGVRSARETYLRGSVIDAADSDEPFCLLHRGTM